MSKATDESIAPESVTLGKPWNRSSAFDAETIARINTAMDAQVRELAELFEVHFKKQLQDFSDQVVASAVKKIAAELSRKQS
jgi:hypothetical protein